MIPNKHTDGRRVSSRLGSERDARDLICDINLNACRLRSANRFNTVKLSQLSYYASPKD